MMEKKDIEMAELTEKWLPSDDMNGEDLVTGVIRDNRTHEGLPNLTVEISCASPNGNSFGRFESDTTDINGNFSILLSSSTVSNLDRQCSRDTEKTDIILRVKSVTGILIHRTILSESVVSKNKIPHGGASYYEIFIDHALELINTLACAMAPNDMKTDGPFLSAA